MPPPAINFRNCPADPGDDSVSEQYSDGHKPQGAPDRGIVEAVRAQVGDLELPCGERPAAHPRSPRTALVPQE